MDTFCKVRFAPGVVLLPLGPNFGFAEELDVGNFFRRLLFSFSTF